MNEFRHFPISLSIPVVSILPFPSLVGPTVSAGPALEVRSDSVGNLFEIADKRQHREHRLNYHTLIPGALGADWVSFF